MLECNDKLLIAYFTNAKKPLDEVHTSTYGITIKKVFFSELETLEK